LGVLLRSRAVKPTDQRERVSLWKLVGFAVWPALIAVVVTGASLIASWELGRGVAGQRVGPVSGHEGYLAYRWRHGMSLEASGSLAEAAKEYEAARAATSPALKAAAAVGLRRVATKAGSPRFAALASAEATLGALRKIAVGVIVVLGVLVALRLWPRRGWMLGEFEVPGSADSPLAAELRRSVVETVTAVQLAYRAPDVTHRLLRERLDVPGLAPPGGSLEAVTSALSGIGDLKIIGVGFSLDKLARAAGDWLPQQRYVVGGRLGESDGEWSASATMERLPDHEPVERWEALESDLAGLDPRPDAPDAGLAAWLITTAGAFGSGAAKAEGASAADSGDEMSRGRRRASALGKLLAYKILFRELTRRGGSLKAHSLLEFYLFTEALLSAFRYAAESDAAALIHGVRCLERLVETSNTQNRLAHYNLGILYLSRGDAESAVRTFQEIDEQIAADVNPGLSRLVAAVNNEVTGGAFVEPSPFLAYLRKAHTEETDEARFNLNGGIYQQVADVLKDLGLWLNVKNANIREDDKQAVDVVLHLLKKLSKHEGTTEVSTFFKGMGAGEEAIRGFARESAEPDKAAGQALATLQSAFCSDELKKVFRAVDLFYDELWFLVHNNKRRAQTIIVDAREAAERGAAELGALPTSVGPKVLDDLRTALRKQLEEEKWAEALKTAKLIRSLTSPANREEARSIIEELLRTTTYRVPRRPRDPYSDELGRVRDAIKNNAVLKLRCLYNLALANFQTFEPEGLYKAYLYAFQTGRELEEGKDLSMPSKDREELAALANCLDYQAVFRIHTEAEDSMPWLFDGDATRKFELQKRRVDAAGQVMSKSLIENFVFNFEISELSKFYSYRTSASVDVRIAAHETLGLWSRYRHEMDAAQPDASADYFATALTISPRANLYAYLAESTYDRKSPEEARKLLRLALRLSPRHALALRLQTLMA
jgi:hypothetical protein